ncbi:MAG: DNA recombination protein RmuC [Gemmataceae bacterium]
MDASLALLLGVLTGIAITTPFLLWIGRLRMGRAVEAAVNEISERAAVLEERLTRKEETVGSLEKNLRDAVTARDQLRQLTNNATKAQALAEQKASAIPGLQKDVETLRGELRTAQRQIEDVKVAHATAKAEAERVPGLIDELEAARRIGQESEQATAQTRTNLATAEEKANQVPILTAELTTTRRAKDAAEKLAREEAILKTAAEEKASQIPGLLSEKQRLEQKADELHQVVTMARERIASLARSLDEKKRVKDEFHDTFRALAGEALQSNNKAFLDLANATLANYIAESKNDLDGRQQAVDRLVKPIGESLTKLDEALITLEQTRKQAYGSLTEKVDNLLTSEQRLRDETARIVVALRSPTVRGRWGELYLRRVVELAGMVEHCDFEAQETIETEDGNLRPDMIVRLPRQKSVVVDSKASMLAYIESLEAPDEETRKEKLRDHARQIRQHVDILASKDYAEHVQPAPDFVVLFLPGEMYFSAALEHDADLIEYALKRKIVLASPTTLISLLRTVAHGWSQENIARLAQEIGKLGKELYKRVGVFEKHFCDLRGGLEKTVKAYNSAVGSMERRVLPAARRLGEMVDPGGKEIPTPQVARDYLKTPQAQNGELFDDQAEAEGKQ